MPKRRCGLDRYIDPANKVLWHLGHVAQLKRDGTTPAPVNVEIDLSNRCSLGCQWCHFAYTHTRGPLAHDGDKPEGRVAGGDLMDFWLARQIIGQLKFAGVQSVTWTGGGEPTLHPQFDEIVQAANNVGLKQGIYTHGGHIGLERAAALKKYMTFVYVSLDECRPETYKQSKGTDRFDTVCENIHRLVFAEGQATIGVGFLIHRDNWQDIPAMVELGRELQTDYIQFRPTIQYDQLHPDRPAEDTSWIDNAIPLLEQAACEPFVVADIDRFRMYQNWQGHGYRRCNWAGMQTVITPNGKVWRCLNKREHADALLGDLSEESFVHIWDRAGGSCAVDGSCRVMCRGHIANITLDAVLSRPVHAEFA